MSFLAPDSAHDEHSLDRADASADPGRDGWRRPYRPGPWRVAVAAVLLVVASYLLFAGLIVAAAGETGRAGVLVGAGVVVTAVAGRLLCCGVRVGRAGLRVTGLLRTTTWRWERIAQVRTVQQPVRLLGLPRTVQGQALVLRPVRGQAPRPLLTDRDADFMGRPEAFDIAADAIEDAVVQARG
nr:PH domain-containing protein [Streptomyces sp. SID5468]